MRVCKQRVEVEQGVTVRETMRIRTRCVFEMGARTNAGDGQGFPSTLAGSGETRVFIVDQLSLLLMAFACTMEPSPKKHRRGLDCRS